MHVSTTCFLLHAAYFILHVHVPTITSLLLRMCLYLYTSHVHYAVGSLPLANNAMHSPSIYIYIYRKIAASCTTRLARQLYARAVNVNICHMTDMGVPAWDRVEIQPPLTKSWIRPCNNLDICVYITLLTLRGENRSPFRQKWQKASCVSAMQFLVNERTLEYNCTHAIYFDCSHS